MMKYLYFSSPTQYLSFFFFPSVSVAMGLDGGGVTSSFCNHTCVSSCVPKRSGFRLLSFTLAADVMGSEHTRRDTLVHAHIHM